jgi:hypothetical protein
MRYRPFILGNFSSEWHEACRLAGKYRSRNTVRGRARAVDGQRPVVAADHLLPEYHSVAPRTARQHHLRPPEPGHPGYMSRLRASPAQGTAPGPVGTRRDGRAPGLRRPRGMGDFAASERMTGETRGLCLVRWPRHHQVHNLQLASFTSSSDILLSPTHQSRLCCPASPPSAPPTSSAAPMVPSCITTNQLFSA